MQNNKINLPREDMIRSNRVINLENIHRRTSYLICIYDNIIKMYTYDTLLNNVSNILITGSELEFILQKLKKGYKFNIIKNRSDIYINQTILDKIYKVITKYYETNIKIDAILISVIENYLMLNVSRLIQNLHQINDIIMMSK